jgi:5'-3' exoribonuclease 2
MMLEIFAYTERVVNMVRPRKLLFMAIGQLENIVLIDIPNTPSDGVAPRAKMNQQRSRRFRAAQEAKEKEEQRLEGIAMFEGWFFNSTWGDIDFTFRLAMGKTVSEETKNTQAWDSNAITPGTPFMTLLADSLRYWVVKKLNNDPGWKYVCQIFCNEILLTNFSSK